MPTEAEEQLRQKMGLEAQFRRVLENYFNSVVSSFLMLGRNGLDLNVSQRFDDALVKILVKQYERVESVFSNRIRNSLPNDVTSTVEEDRAISNALERFNSIRSRIQSRNINRTTQNQIQESLVLARSFDTETDRIEDGRVVRIKQGLVGFELFLTAGEVLKRKLSGRIPTIINTETQVIAEVAKLTEVEIVSNIVPSITGRVQNELDVTKIWVTMGDSRVRDTHLMADGQERKANKPFLVGGDSLMVPGDSSLGASKEETINCRCVSIFNEKEIIAIRRRVNEDPFVATNTI